MTPEGCPLLNDFLDLDAAEIILSAHSSAVNGRVPKGRSVVGLFSYFSFAFE